MKFVICKFWQILKISKEFREEVLRTVCNIYVYFVRDTFYPFGLLHHLWVFSVFHTHYL